MAEVRGAWGCSHHQLMWGHILRAFIAEGLSADRPRSGAAHP